MTKREMPFMPLEYVPTPGDREKRCSGFVAGRIARKEQDERIEEDGTE